MRKTTARLQSSAVATLAVLLATVGCGRSRGDDAPATPSTELTPNDPPAASEGTAGNGAVTAEGAPVGVDAGSAGADADAAPVVRTYVVASRTILSRGIARTFLLATPDPMPARPPLVLALHGDGGTPEGLRASLGVEEAAKGDAVVVYPAAPDGIFEYWTDEGRSAEAGFVTDVVSLLGGELGIDTGRVFLAGFSGGATMANALGCVLGAGVVRGVGIHSGTLYPVTSPGGPVACTLPSAIVVWGTADATYGTTYPEGERTRDRYRDNLACSATTAPSTPAPCVAYDGCRAPLTWCPIEGQGHAMWSLAGAAIWAHFAALR
jgi:polyhydroxybutyrate depolymerase